MSIKRASVERSAIESQTPRCWIRPDDVGGDGIHESGVSDQGR